MVTFAATSAGRRRKLMLERIPWSKGTKIEQAHDSDCCSTESQGRNPKGLNSRMGKSYQHELRGVSEWGW